MKLVRNIAAILAAAAAAGCASTAPPELVAARSAYDSAANGSAGQLDLVDLHTAKETLQVAEQYFHSEGDTQETKDIAYTAERRAELAAARADAVASLRLRDNTLARTNERQLAQGRRASADLARANHQLDSNRVAIDAGEQALSAEKKRTSEAEERAALATSELARIATVRQGPTGMVITLSGSVLFASEKADLLSTAQSKLVDVAKALTMEDSDANIVVQGFTDSRGSDAFNQELSQHRADTVRDFLVAHGLSADRVTAQGMGPGNPIADNASAEGRANNRRVEILIQPHKT